jgi:hypothetical protein
MQSCIKQYEGKMMTKEQALGFAETIAWGIRELREVPSGHLYAQVMNRLSLQEYQVIIDVLKESGFITESNHVLKWVQQ